MKKRINIESEWNYKIDIGCKNLKKKGFIGIDILDFGQEIVWDITGGLPFPDNSITEIFISHTLEHIEEKDVAPLFVEMYRVCEDGAKIDIVIPHSDNIQAYYLGHVSYWNEKRIKGIVKSLSKCFAIVKMFKKGIELIARLKISK